MAEKFEALLSKGELDYVQDIVAQIPETMGARNAFIRILNALAERQTKENRRKLEKLAALENAGVDNWEWYDALEEVHEQWDEEDEEEKEDEK